MGSEYRSGYDDVANSDEEDLGRQENGDNKTNFETSIYDHSKDTYINTATDQEAGEKARHQSEECDIRQMIETGDSNEELEEESHYSKEYQYTQLINAAQGDDFWNSNTTLQPSDSEQTKEDNLPMQQNAIDNHHTCHLYYSISMHRSLDPVPEEEDCLVEKIYHDNGIHYTEPDTNQIVHNNLNENILAIMHTQIDRGDKPPVSTLNVGSSFNSLKRPVMSNNLRSFASTDDGSSLNETTVGVSSGYCTGRSDYSESSFKAQIVGAGSSGHIKRVNLAGVYSETDKVPCKKGQTLGINPSDDLDAQSKCSDYTTTKPKLHNDHVRHVHIPHDFLLPTVEQTHQHVENQPKLSVNKVTAATNKITGYNKSTYSVLVGNCVKVYSTTLFASLPHHNKYMVKDRMKETGKVKLTLKSNVTHRCVSCDMWLHMYTIVVCAIHIYM